MAKATTKPADKTQPADPSLDSLERVKQDYRQFYTYIQPYRLKWEDYWKLWNNQRVRRQYDGDSDAFDPMTFQMVETMVDNVYGSRPKITFMPTQKDQETDTKVLNGLWDYSWDRANMDKKGPIWGREITITGNGCLFPYWSDGFMGVRHFPLRDCIFDTAATTDDPDDDGFMRFAGYRRLELVDNLKKATRFDPEQGDKDATGAKKGKWVSRYTNLDQIVGIGTAAGDFTDKQLKEAVYVGSTLSNELQKNQVEVICMWYKDKVIEVANRSTVIYEGPNPYSKPAQKITVQLRDEQGNAMYDEKDLPEGAKFMDADELADKLTPVSIEVDVPAIDPFIPMVMQRGYVDPALLIGKGDVETISTGQEDLNDSLNVKKDNIVYSVQNVGLIDSLSKDAIPQLAQAKPGSIVSVKNLSNFPNTFKWMEKPNYTVAATEEIARAKESIRDTMRISPIAQGIIPPGIRTAMEITSLVSIAQQGFKTKIAQLESGAYKQLGEMFVKMVQIFLTEEQLVRIVGKEGVEFKNFVPGKYWGPYDVKVVLESEFEAQAKQESDQAVEAYQMFNGDPDINQIELKKKVLTKAFNMDEDDLDALLAPNPNNQAMMGDQPTGDVAAGTPGTPPGVASPAAPMPAPPAPAAKPMGGSKTYA